MAVKDLNSLERRFAEYGLVDVARIEPSVRVDMKYSTPGNFIGEDMYGPLETAWLVPEMAARVASAQRALRKSHPGFSLVIFDAARPLSIQRRMYSRVAGTPLAAYVADPGHEGGGFHNYGLAVDLSIADEEGRLLDMGSPFDHFGEESHSGREDELVAAGSISAQAAANRRMLYGIMAAEGLTPHPNEWWHYQHTTDDEAKRRHRLLDF